MPLIAPFLLRALARSEEALDEWTDDAPERAISVNRSPRGSKSVRLRRRDRDAHARSTLEKDVPSWSTSRDIVRTSGRPFSRRSR